MLAARALDALMNATDTPRDGRISSDTWSDDGSQLWRRLPPAFREAIDKRNRFHGRDADGDGAHSRGEAAEAMRARDGGKGAPTPLMVLTAADRDGDGRLSLAEFVAAERRKIDGGSGAPRKWAARDGAAKAPEDGGAAAPEGDAAAAAPDSAPSDAELEARFRRADADGDGFHDALEIRAELDAELDARVGALFEEHDLDRDGALAFHEFAHMERRTARRERRRARRKAEL